MTTAPTIPDAAVEDRLAFAITEIARQSPDRAAIVAAAGSTSRRAIDYSALAAAVEKLEAALDAHRPVGVVARAVRVESLVAIAAACGRQHVPVAFLAEDSRDLVGELGRVEFDQHLPLADPVARIDSKAQDATRHLRSQRRLADRLDRRLGSDHRHQRPRLDANRGHLGVSGQA